MEQITGADADSDSVAPTEIDYSEAHDDAHEVNFITPHDGGPDGCQILCQMADDDAYELNVITPLDDGVPDGSQMPSPHDSGPDGSQMPRPAVSPAVVSSVEASAPLRDWLQCSADPVMDPMAWATAEVQRAIAGGSCTLSLVR